MSKPSVHLLILFIGIVSSALSDKPKSAYKHIRLNTDLVRTFKVNENILIECPIEKLASTRVRRSAVITSWFKDNTKLSQFNVNEERIDLYQRILKIKNIRASDSGIYFCEIISGSGITVRSHSLTIDVIDVDNSNVKMESKDSTFSYATDAAGSAVGEAPIFQNRDYDNEFTLLELSSVYFDCSSIGLPAPSIRWLKNGQIISEEDYGLIGNIMQLNLNNLRVGDSGNYTCQVSNQFGKLNRTFSLNVLESLKFVDNDPLNQTIALNSPAVFKCQVDSIYNGFGNTRITWYIHVNEANKFQDLSQVSSSSQAIQINGENFYELNLYDYTQQTSTNFQRLSDNSLVINKVNFNNAGAYLCFANNTRGYNYKQFNLEVVQASVIQPSNALINLFKNGQIKGVVSEKSEFNTIWSGLSLSLPVIFIIVTGFVALVIIIALFYCYKNI